MEDVDVGHRGLEIPVTVRKTWSSHRYALKQTIDHSPTHLPPYPRPAPTPTNSIAIILHTQLGVDVACSDTGCPPVSIKAAGLGGGTARVSGKISSQYLSALLIAAPLSSGEVVIEITDELVSAPYVHMTIKLMEKFG